MFVSLVVSEVSYNPSEFDSLCTWNYCVVLGDWHCAYVLLYGPRLLEITPSEEEMATE